MTALSEIKVLGGDRLIDGDIINAILAALADGGITNIIIANANGVSGIVNIVENVATITYSLGAITPASVAAVGTVTGSNLSGSNTGDQTIILTGDVTGAGTGSFATTIGASKVLNSMLAGSITASKLVGTDIATIGTVTSGTWNATPIGVAYGGTNISSYTVGDIIYASGSATLSTLADVATGNALISGGITTAPVWGKIGLSTHVSGTLGVANGGTGQSSYTDGQLMIGNTATGLTSKSTLTAGSGISITNGNGTISIEATGSGGSVTTVSVVTANGVSGSVANATTTPAITLTLGAINPSSIGATTAIQTQGFRPTNYQTGTTYTLVLSDAGKMVDMANGSAITLTVPPNGSVANVAEAEIDLFQSGSGQVTVTPGSGVTIISYTSKTKLAGQYAGATLKQTSTTDTWRLVGNLA